MNINWNGQYIQMNDEFSGKDYTGKTLTVENLSGNIYGSCFSQETPDTVVFPANMSGVNFYNCNLDNCLIPPGNIIHGRQPKRFMVQADGNDWLVDENNTPIERL